MFIDFKSQYSIFNFAQFFYLLIFLGLALLLYDFNSLESSILTFCILFTFYLILTKFPIITINSDSVTLTSILGRKKYHWDEISKIELIAKRRSIISYGEEVTVLQLVNNKEIIIWLKYYKNSPELRTTLNNAYQAFKGTVDIHPTAPKSIFVPQEIRFKGNPYRVLSFYAAICLATIIFMVVKHYSFETIALTTFAFVLLILSIRISNILHYFIFSQDELIVKNYIWFWKEHKYKINEIKEMSLEYRYRELFYSLRVTTNSFQSKSYGAKNINTKMWEEFIGVCKQYNINVKKED